MTDKSAKGSEVKKGNRDVSLDAMKAAALMMVLALHTQLSLTTGELYDPILYYAARFAMPLFFMVNGSLILRKKEIGAFYCFRKILNILRILIFWSVILVVYSMVVSGTGLIESLKNGGRGFMGQYMITFWFLHSFAILYVLALIFHKKIIRHEKVVLVGLIVVCVAVDAASLISIRNGGYFYQAKLPLNYRMWTWAMYFVLGHFLGSIDKAKLQKKKWLIVLSCAVMTAAAVVYQNWLCNSYLHTINSEYCYDSLLIIVWSALVFLLFRVFDGSTVEKWLAKLAPYGFGAFLLHIFFIAGFHLGDIGSNALHAAGIWVLLIVISWTASWVLDKVPGVRRLFRY